MVVIPDFKLDPTLEAMFLAMESIESAVPRRGYLGASSIGDDCERKLFYQFNGYERLPMERRGIMATQDGHRCEEIMASRLRLVPGIQLWTAQENGEQFGFSKYEDKYQGHYDGIILGLLQSPMTPHTWEHKACNEKKFNELKKCIDDYGEKNALENWDIIYYAQAQTYMGELELSRHYLTVSTPGFRDVISCRTEFNRLRYESYDSKAVRIITAKSPPARISERREYFKCKFCPYTTICHEKN